MDNMLEKIYKYVYIGAFVVNGIAILFFNINAVTMTIWKTLLVFVIVTFIVFLMGRLVEERFDNTLQMYLIIVSIAFLVSTFIPKDLGLIDEFGESLPFKYGWPTFWSAVSSLAIFAAAFFLDGIFESE
jgi:MFS superfamily sulfate permease-like transporter